MKKEGSRILVIDDNPKNLDVLSDLFEQENFSILFALDGESGVQRAELGQPKLILLDIMMPGIDGFETCRRLKANALTRNIPVIFMTALSETSDKVHGFQLGAIDYITKPFQPEEVLARIHTHLTIQDLQEELRRNNLKLQASLEREKELNVLKSRFLSIASHEFRTPLTAIRMTANTMKRYRERMSEEKHVAGLERIESAVMQLTKMLDDVLLLSKVDAEIHEFVPQRMDVKKLCLCLVEEFDAFSEETHTIHFSSCGSDFHLSADPKLLRHILSNLLSNALKYSPVGSSVYVKLERSNERIIFRVVDEGIGIGEHDKKSLFSAFQRGENVGEIPGSGLGLTMTKQFVELHGGTIECESELDKGTTFTVSLPVEHV